MSCSVIYDDRSNLYIYQKEYANEFPRVTQPQQACLCSREGLCYSGKKDTTRTTIITLH